MGLRDNLNLYSLKVTEILPVAHILVNTMDESDSDFSDLGDIDSDVGEVAGPRLNKNGIKIRGPDKSWDEIYRFKTASEYKSSDICKRLKDEFSNRKTREYDYGDVHEYECKFTRRKGYLPCPWKMKVTFFSDNSEVTVEAVEGATDHVHEEDTDFVENSSKNFRWTDEMTKYVTEGIQNNHRPNFILRKMKKSNMFDKLPSKTQLYNKCAATKKTENPSHKINNTNEMRNKVAEFLGEPTSEVKAFVPFHEILDDDDTKEPRFTVIFSTKKNLKKLKSERVLQTDETYKLNWLGFPVFVVGKNF